MAAPTERILRFGIFALDVRAGELRRHGKRIRLQEQSFRILSMLLDRPGEVVLREEIRLKLWPNNTIVDFDHSINAAIKRLRGSLGESAEEPRYIETLAKRGYRFLGEVEDESPVSESAELAAEPVVVAADAPETKTLTHYRLLNQLGSGGMGVVYRAEDLRLGRQVALKLLPDGAASNPATRQRFEREARAASALNHPNICSIYGFENVGGQDAIVMELVEGETLAARLKQGPLASYQALTLAIQIADALDEAQRKGVVHRDLKPSNIMLTGRSSSGLVAKILDFGIAKMEDPAIAGNATEPGAVLGTWNYMSPEQAEGEDADTRSDIYSFGVVLHEMLTGERPPAKESFQLLPSNVGRVLRRCLEKDREDRWQSARDLKAELRWVAEQPEAIAPAMPKASHGNSRLIWAAIGAVAALSIAIPAALFFGEKPEDRGITRFSIYPPATTRFGTAPSPAVSPDGRWIAFGVNPSAGAAQLWLRALDSPNAIQLVGTEGAYRPFWSPDSKSIGFFADRKMKRIDLGGPSGAASPVILCDTPEAVGGGTWSREGVIVFAVGNHDIYQMRDTGGSPSVVARADTSGSGSVYLNPSFLPDGRHFLFTGWKRGEPIDRVTIRVGSIDSPGSKPIREASSHAVFTHSRLIFVQDHDLMAQPFDSRKLALTGEPARLAGQILSSPNVPGLGLFAASENGPLVYMTGAGIPNYEMAWFDRKGNRLSTLGETAAIEEYGVRLSPDQKTVAVTITESDNTDIWLYDASSGVRTRLTFDPAHDISPVWSPDGKTIAFASNRKGHLDLYSRWVDGSGAENLLFADVSDKAPLSWSSNGEFLLYERNAAGVTELWALPLTGGHPGDPRKPFSVFEATNPGRKGQFSPDGRWVAFNESWEAKDPQTYLAPFRPEGRPRTATNQVSRTSGMDPQWRKDGKEIFFKSGRSLMVADVDLKENTARVGEQRELFGPLMSIYSYAVAAGGQRFLFLLRNPRLASQPLTVVESWTTMLGK